MKVKYFVPILTSIIFILIPINSIIGENFGVNECATYGNQCNALLKTPCCNESLACKYVEGSFTCIESVLLGSLCKDDADCSTIPHARCSKKHKCICEVNSTRISRSECAPLLGASCEENDVCAVDGSECSNENQCQCSEGFVQLEDRCLRTLIHASCEGDKSCEDIEFAKCSANGLCTCTSNTISVNLNSCLPRLNFSCQINDECKVINSICVDNKCQCRPNYEYRQHSCVSVYLNKQCDNYKDCSDIFFATCSKNKKCICQDKYVAVNGTKCESAFDGYCDKNQKCAFNNLICVDNQCQCKPSYKYVEATKQCHPVKLGKSCGIDFDCRLIPNSRCSINKICVCEDDHFAINQTKCLPVFNGFCLNNQECKFPNFRCVDNRCQCRSTFLLLSADRCHQTDLLFDCIDPSECSDWWHARCSEDNKCVCASNNIATSRSTCLPILNGKCWRDDQCLAENSVCDDYRCQCKPNFIAIADNVCVSID